MAEVDWLFDGHTAGTSVAAGDQGVDSITASPNNPTYVAGIHTGTGIRCYSPSGVGSYVETPTLPVTPNDHSGSLYFESNNAALANSVTFLCIQTSSNSNHIQVRINANGYFAIKPSGTVVTRDDVPTIPNQQPIRLDWQYSWSAGAGTFLYRVFVGANSEGTVADFSGSVSTSQAAAVDGLRMGPTGTATIQDFTFDTLRLYDGAVWADPFNATPPPVGTTATTRSLLSNVSNNSISVVGSTTNATSLRMAVSTSSDMSSPVFSAVAVPDTYGKTLHTVTGLSTGTQYYYQLMDTPSGGAEQAFGSIGEAKTLPASGTPAGFTVVLGSCLKNGSDGTAINSANAWNPDFFVHVGDYHYKALKTEVEADHVNGYDAQTQTEAPGLSTFLQNTPIFYVRSDHEAGVDNGDSNDNLTVVSISAQNKVFPATLADTRNPVRARYQTWAAGRVRFILLDMRTPDRSPGLNADNSSKTMLGATQKQWLKDMLLMPEPVKVVISDVAWSGPASTTNGEDKWWSYDTERREIASFITANGVNVDFWHGDSHFIAADRTHNTWGGFPVLCGSPLYSNGGGRNQEYFDNLYTVAQTDFGQQYLRITFADNGTQITRTAVGWDATTATQKFTQTVTWDTQAGSITITLWDGTQEQPVTMSVFNGTQEVAGSLEVV